MLYATIDKKLWCTQVPMRWDKVQAMFQHLNRMTWGYQLEFASSMFNLPEHPPIQARLIKWESHGRPSNNRTVLVETTEPEQMQAALFMLINEAEAQTKAQDVQKVWL